MNDEQMREMSQYPLADGQDYPWYGVDTTIQCVENIAEWVNHYAEYTYSKWTPEMLGVARAIVNDQIAAELDEITQTTSRADGWDWSETIIESSGQLVNGVLI